MTNSVKEKINSVWLEIYVLRYPGFCFTYNVKKMLMFQDTSFVIPADLFYNLMGPNRSVIYIQILVCYRRLGLLVALQIFLIS